MREKIIRVIVEDDPPQKVTDWGAAVGVGGLAAIAGFALGGPAGALFCGTLGTLFGADIKMDAPKE